MTECAHENFKAKVGVHRLTKIDDGPVTGYVAEVTINCVGCGRPFQFLGLKPGYDTQGVTVSIDGLIANLALAPQGTALSPLDRLAYSIGAHRNVSQ